MPFGDRTGPLGLGPMTGRAAGYCAGYSVPGYMNPIPGRGWGWFGRGRGRGWGRGWGRGFGRGWVYPYAMPYSPNFYDYPYGPDITPQQEVDMLKQQAKTLQEEIKAIYERVNELESLEKKKKKTE